MAAQSTRPENRAVESPRSGGLQRTLTGLGGVRLIEMEGVAYPERVLRARPGYERRSGEAYREAPAWGISTREAARLLGCSEAAAREYLHRHRVRFRVVAEQGRPCCNYWQRSAVQALVKARGEIVLREPERLMGMEEALAVLGVGRSTLQRYVRSGMLRQVKLRLLTGRGLKERAYFLPGKVRALAGHLRALRAREAELRAMRERLKRTCGPGTGARAAGPWPPGGNSRWPAHPQHRARAFLPIRARRAS